MGENMNKKNNYTLLIIICVILLAIVGLLSFEKEDKDEKINKSEKNYILLDDYSRFFTIDACVDKYINDVTSNSKDDLMKVLDKDYIDNNGINFNNVDNYILKLDGNYSFKAKKIFYEEINTNFIKYYVYGDLIEETMDVIGEKQDLYVIVKFDTKNNLFSITPYDGEVFKEGNNG